MLNKNYKFKNILLCTATSLFFISCSSISSVTCHPSLQIKDGVVIDNKTGLMWTKYDEFSKNRSNGGWISWDDAMRNASQLKINNYSDWRVPSQKELFTLFNRECIMKGTTFVESFSLYSSPLFDNPTYPYFWTSESKGKKAFGIDFRTGKVLEIKKVGGNTVRYVRTINE